MCPACVCWFLGYFYPRPPRGGRHYKAECQTVDYKISIHALREEGDCQFALFILPNILISIHALREEGDGLCMVVDDEGLLFLSTPSARRATPAR